jgi:hypothetical protein
MTHIRIIATAALLLRLSSVWSDPLHAQGPVPVIRATAPLVDVRDGREFKKGTWRISPQIKPDVYITHTKHESVTFVTDIDSISFLIEPGCTYQFIILLNGKDSALTEVRYAPGVLDILKSASTYDLQDRTVAPEFTYTSADAPELCSLERRFNLDSVAGAGDEISKILNLLHWVHTTFPHDGSKDAPNANSIEELMSICSRDHMTLDCGSLARVLSDCYAAMGFKARRIVCLPEDSTDVDCHSIDVVYSRTLKKWLWMDPTNDAYIMGEHGELLSIADVRERLITDRPLQLNPDANWNHVNKVTAGYYIYNYMTKNLFAFEYFYESGGVTRSIVLLPTEYRGILPRTRPFHPDHTHNPAVFWAVPE